MATDGLGSRFSASKANDLQALTAFHLKPWEGTIPTCAVAVRARQTGICSAIGGVLFLRRAFYLATEVVSFRLLPTIRVVSSIAHEKVKVVR